MVAGMLHSLYQRLKSAISNRMRQTITRSGLIFSLVISIVGSAAFLSGNNLLFLLLASLFSILLISGFINRLSLAGLELDLILPEHIPARRRVPTRLRLRNEKGWMPSFSILVAGATGSVYTQAIYFPVLPGGETVEETVEVVFQRRGPHSENSFFLRSRFPFGFAERNIQVTMRRELLVYPSIDPQPGFEQIRMSLEGELDAYARGHGHDFYRIRPYENLESARHVDWKATAHTSQLQVREFAREQEPLVEVFLDLAVPSAGASWFEKAVDCCAFLCWELNSRGARIRFRTQDFDLQVPSEGDIYTILKYLALVHAGGYKAVSGPGREDSFQVVFSVNPEKVLAAGWNHHHLYGMDAFPAYGSVAEPGRAKA